jgi:hypothetical protein
MNQRIVRALQKFHKSLVLRLLQRLTFNEDSSRLSLMLCKFLLWPGARFIKEMLPKQDDDDDDESYDVCSDF